MGDLAETFRCHLPRLAERRDSRRKAHRIFTTRAHAAKLLVHEI